MVARAIILDRDGVINEMVYYPEHGIVDSPFTAEQFILVEGIGGPLKKFKRLGYELILCSNQPGIAKGHFTKEEFKKVQLKMTHELTKIGIRLDGEYYCFHHPMARLKKYKTNCSCRKPKPGMIIRAAKEHGLSLAESVVIGDGINDVSAGTSAGCKTILLGNANTMLMHLLAEAKVKPEFTLHTLSDSANVVETIVLGKTLVRHIAR
jgi:D-glycero-D-manno-heptose 1,7-bisphosphate phosphatase